jgi:hypothetical protein
MCLAKRVGVKMKFYYKTVLLVKANRKEGCYTIHCDSREQFLRKLAEWNASPYNSENGTWKYVEVHISCVKKLFPKLLKRDGWETWPKG